MHLRDCKMQPVHFNLYCLQWGASASGIQEQNTPKLIVGCIKQIKSAVAVAIVLNDQKTKTENDFCCVGSCCLTVWGFPAVFQHIQLVYQGWITPQAMTVWSVVLKLKSASHRVWSYLRSWVQVLWGWLPRVLVWLVVGFSITLLPLRLFLSVMINTFMGLTYWFGRIGNYMWCQCYK